MSKATYEYENIDGVDVNVECENDESIMGKVFDTTDDVYNFYNDYVFVHWFGIHIHTTLKNKGTNEPYKVFIIRVKSVIY